VAGSIAGKVVGVTDGDSLKVLMDGRQTAVRLEGIDAPETSQPFGKAAKAALSDLVFGRVVVLVPLEKPDRYGRTLARVLVGGVDVNQEMVRQGLAWHYLEYSTDQSLAAAESEAWQSQRGLWQMWDQSRPGSGERPDERRLEGLQAQIAYSHSGSTTCLGWGSRLAVLTTRQTFQSKHKKPS
jgi:endonuclease YncB( thermonuclease family)